MPRRALAVLFALFLQAWQAAAQELTPRAYWPAPEGTRVATVGYQYTSGDISPDPSLPVTGLDSEIDTLQLGYLQTLSLFGRTTNFKLEVPYVDGSTEAVLPDGRDPQRAYDGVGDVAVTLAMNFLGAPSMDQQDFSTFRKDPPVIVAGSIKVVAPTGNYDDDRVVNVGANRWAAKLDIGALFPFADKWVFEADVGVWFFDDNDDFVGFTREQKPIYSFQSHLVHRFRPGFWGSIDASYFRGGRSEIDGESLDDLQRDTKLGFTLAYPFARGHVAKLGYSYGSVNDDDEDFHVYQLSYSRLF